MDDDQVEIYPAHDDLEDTAAKLLKAADDAGEQPEVVETVHGDTGMGFRVPADVAKKAGLGGGGDAKPAPAKKTAQHRT